MIYDDFQKEAIKHIDDEKSVIVSAPTGSGKTVIAEYVIEKCIREGKRAIYTAPIKALSNQKFRDFESKYGEKVGILTGDVSINSEAELLIMTTEIFRNSLLEGSRRINNVSWVIFDEIHYIDDYERGTVWEESIIFMPRNINMLALSATIPNIEELAGWISGLYKKQIKIVTEDKRPVPLEFLFQYDNKIMTSFSDLKKQSFRHEWRNRDVTNKLSTLIKYMKKEETLPCIFFSFSRRRCEYLCHELRTWDFLTSEERKEILFLYDSLVKRFDLENEKSAVLMRELVQNGIAFHHAGLLPTLKEVVERLFTSKILKVIFTTETFALGINMPARSVVFDDLKKFYIFNFGFLKTRDFYQMAGRSGRRGMDEKGFVFMRATSRIPVEEVKRIIYGKPERVESQFNSSYATLLNLYRNNKENIYDIFNLSFFYYQQDEKNKERGRQLLRAKISVLKDLGHICSGNLTEKGEFASKIFGYELLTAELYEKNFFEDLSVIELAIFAVALVFEPRKNQSLPHMPKHIKKMQKNIQEVISPIRKAERKFKIYPITKTVYFHLALATEKWVNGEDFSKLLHFCDVDEGEIVRYFRMAIQILREIENSKISPQLQIKIARTINLFNRGVINAEKQLRS